MEKHENPWWQGAIACLLGTVVGLAVSHQFHWPIWLGMVIGGTLAYFSWDPKKVWRAVSQSCQKIRDWLPDKQRLKTSFYMTLSAFALSTSLHVFLIVLYLLNESHSLTDIDQIFQMMFVYMAGCVVFSFILFTYLNNASNEWNQDRVNQAKLLIRYGNPLAVYVYWPIRGLIWLAPKLSKFAFYTFWIFAFRFVKTFFIIVHCRARWLCLVDTVLAIAITHFLFRGNLLIGGLAGAIFWIFSREIIAIRWLKIIPNGAKVQTSSL
ncbi:MAG: hypothetical protein V1668_04795 [Patescibacteria group bacterium]